MSGGIAVLNGPFKLVAYDGTVLGVVWMPSQDAEEINRRGLCRKVHVAYMPILRTELPTNTSSVVDCTMFALEKSGWCADAVTLIGVDPEMLDDVPGYSFIPGCRYVAWVAKRDSDRATKISGKPVDSGPHLRAARDVA